jgi:hypothetical protein
MQHTRVIHSLDSKIELIFFVPKKFSFLFQNLSAYFKQYWIGSAPGSRIVKLTSWMAQAIPFLMSVRKLYYANRWMCYLYLMSKSEFACITEKKHSKKYSMRFTRK